jgi:putative peptidoglycan lipid II flippase
MVTNMVLNLVFVGLLLTRGFEGPHAGLALASSVAAYLNAMLLYRGLKTRAVLSLEKGWLRLGIAVLLASVSMAALLHFMTRDIEAWLQASAVLRVQNLALTIAFGVLVYIFVCMVAGIKKHDLLRGSH